MQRLRTALTPWRALLLAALLLAAQAAGLGHLVVHGPIAPALAPAMAATAGFWGHGYAHDHGDGKDHPASGASAECRLYDQLLGHADVLVGMPAVVTAVALAVVRPLPDQASRSGCAAAAYQARAPPPA